MNDFEYRLELSKIDSCKYVKDIRELLYEYANRFNVSYWRNSENLALDTKHYKLYSKAYYKFTNSSKAELPDKFFNKLVEFQRMLLDTITEGTTGANTPYNDVMNIFEYTEHITVPHLDYAKFYNFCNIIGDNPFPFRVNILVYTSALQTSGYFNNLSNNDELIILSWMKVNNIPESNTIAQLFRKQHQYINTQKSYDATITERANLVLALEAVDQLTGVPIEQQ